MTLWRALSLSLSEKEEEDIFFINEIFNFYLGAGPRPFNPLRLGQQWEREIVVQQSVQSADIPSGRSNNTTLSKQ